jgi:hypothetical protein
MTDLEHKKLKREVSDRFTTQERRREIAKINDYFAQRAAKSKHSTPELLSELSQHESWLVRWHVAENLKTPNETLVVLSQDQNGIVVKYVAQNPNTPLHILQMLTKHEFWGVIPTPIIRLQ